MRCPVKCFECGTYTMSIDLSKDHYLPRFHRGDPSGVKCERVWCAVCVARVEIKISPEWLKQQHIAELN